MTIKKYVGRITVLGDSVSTTEAGLSKTTYSYIEFEGGEIIKRLNTMTGLNGHLQLAYKDDETVELHVNEMLTGVPQPGSVLLAIRRGNGRLYAVTVPPVPFSNTIVQLILVVFGLLTCWIWGLGLIFWFIAWKSYKGTRILSQTYDYVKSLDGATEI